MFVIVKTSEGWTVRDDEFGAVLDTYARLSDAQARLALIAQNTADLESFRRDHPGSQDALARRERFGDSLPF